MKKNGFTLVELLAVVAIVAILVVIALPNIILMYNNAKKSAFETEVKTIYKQAEIDYLSSNISNSGERYYCSGDRNGETGDSKDECINVNMSTNKEYYIEMNSKGKVSCIAVKDGTFAYVFESPNDVSDISKDDIKNANESDIDLEDCSDLFNGTLDGIEANFLTGSEVNIKMKLLAGNTINNNSVENSDTKIKAIKRSLTEPTAENKEYKNLVSTSDSPYPIYMWYENNTIYYWSQDTTPNLNRLSNTMFYRLEALEDIEDLANFDASNLAAMNWMFGYCSKLPNLNSLSSWSTPRLVSMAEAFDGCASLVSMDGVKNWNVKHVKDMWQLFACDYSLETIDLSNWRTKSLVSFGNVFGMWDNRGYPYLNSKLKRIYLSDKFDTSKVTSMYGLLANNRMIEDYSFLSYLDVSSVKVMDQFFQYNTSLKNVDALSNWNTSNLESMIGMFQITSSLTNLDGLKNWNTSKVKKMNSLFNSCPGLIDASGISNWNTSSVEDMGYMFRADNGTSKLTNLDISKWNMSKVKKYDYFMLNLKSVNSEFTINNPDVTSYSGMLLYCANSGGKVVVNYTAATESLVDRMIATKSSGANVIKGVLVE